jgi:uncharacterized protein with von Willebrand factor type A (vWA) domain
MPKEATFIIDVSGSVNSDFVERVINSIIDNASGVDLSKSHVIFCDTSVTSDEIMSKRTKKAYSGGGTDIAKGIKYVAEKGYCKKAEDMLFVVSDMQDTLSQWCQEAKKLRCKRFAVGYGYSNKKEAQRIFQYGIDNNSLFSDEWNRLFKTVLLFVE